MKTAHKFITATLSALVITTLTTTSTQAKWGQIRCELSCGQVLGGLNIEKCQDQCLNNKILITNKTGDVLKTFLKYYCQDEKTKKDITFTPDQIMTLDKAKNTLVRDNDKMAKKLALSPECEGKFKNALKIETTETTQDVKSATTKSAPDVTKLPAYDVAKEGPLNANEAAVLVTGYTGQNKAGNMLAQVIAVGPTGGNTPQFPNVNINDTVEVHADKLEQKTEKRPDIGSLLKVKKLGSGKQRSSNTDDKNKLGHILVLLSPSATNDQSKHEEIKLLTASPDAPAPTTPEDTSKKLDRALAELSAMVGMQKESTKSEPSVIPLTPTATPSAPPQITLKTVPEILAPQKHNESKDAFDTRVLKDVKPWEDLAAQTKKTSPSTDVSPEIQKKLTHLLSEIPLRDLQKTPSNTAYPEFKAYLKTRESKEKPVYHNSVARSVTH